MKSKKTKISEAIEVMTYGKDSSRWEATEDVTILRCGQLPIKLRRGETITLTPKGCKGLPLESLKRLSI